MKKQGYTRVPNSFLEAIARNPAFCEKTRVLWAIIRKTAGWNKKSDLLSNTQIAKLTGMKPSNVSRAVRRLVAEKIISTSGEKFRMKVISLDMLPDQIGYAGISKSTTTKDTQSKDILQKTVPDEKTKTTTNVPTTKVIGLMTDAEIESMGKKFRAIGMEIADWDEPYADKTWNQRTNLRTENREKYYQKIRRIVFFYNQKGEGVRRLARKMCYEAAGLVNDLGAMERQIDDKEIARRKKFSDDLREESDDFIESKVIDSS